MTVMQKILLVEDDIELAIAIMETLELGGYECDHVTDGQQAIDYIEKKQPHLVLCDVNLPKINGFQFIDYVKRKVLDLPIILMTAYGAIADAIKAIQLGAKDYLVKPFSPDDLMEKVRILFPHVENDAPVAEDDKSKRIFALAKKAAESDVTVLISGESGTGKEVLAQYIHDQSTRSKKPFVAVNCAAIPENMLEATLFGYEKGSFTGAIKPFPGKFEQAQGGTILLDEISEMDLGLQAKILRVIQEREVERIGSTQTINLDVRIVATTNRDLRATVAEKQFREDLYYRLNVFPLKWLPIRDRTDDILPIAEYLIEKHSHAMGKGAPELSESAKKRILSYSWPGNIRELDNVVQRSLVLCHDSLITADDLLMDMFADIDENRAKQESAETCLSKNVQGHEYDIINATLCELNGSRKETAKHLGISERTLRNKLAKMRDLGIELEAAS